MPRAQRNGDGSIRRLSGKAAFYRPKNPRPHGVLLTEEGSRLLARVQKRTKKSRSDIFEHLLRLYGKTLEFPRESET